jgi:hypothetical protein
MVVITNRVALVSDQARSSGIGRLAEEEVLAMTKQTVRTLLAASAVAVTLMAWTKVAPGAAVVVAADEGQARQLLKAMTDYVGSQKAISFDYDSNLEVVTKDKQRLALAASGAVTLVRPDKIYATRSGGFVKIETFFDGKTLTLLGRNKNVYTQVEIPGSIDHLIDELQHKYDRPLPAADLLLTDAYEGLMAAVIDVKDLGSGVIGGTECDYLAFRTEEVDAQLWIAQGARPYPCRYVITSKRVTDGPQYSIQIRNWNAGGNVETAAFGFKAPPGAKRIELAELQKMKNMGELPSHFLLGGQ